MNVLAASVISRVASDMPLLTILVVLPLAGAIVVGVLPLSRDRVRYRLGVIIAWLVALLGVVAVLGYSRAHAGLHFASSHRWFESAGISWSLGVDGVSLPLVVLTALVVPIVMHVVDLGERRGSHVALILLLESAMLGAFVARDAFLFFVCFELVLVPTYFLMLGWGFADRRRSAMKFFLYTFVGSVFLLVGLIATAVLVAQSTSAPLSFDYEALRTGVAKLGSGTEQWLFLLCAIGFAVKAPLVPLHTWIRDTYEQAPFSVAALSSAVMVKLGAYGLIRFGIELFPRGAHEYGLVFLTLGVVGAVYGALVAVGQKDLRGLIAYSSVSHLGVIVMGIFAFQLIALTGAMVQMVSHGIVSTLMIVLAAALYRRTGTLSLDALSGLQRVVPVLAGVMIFAALANIGVPALSGFVGEFMVFIGTFLSHRWWAVAGTFSLIAGAIYILWAYQRMFHGPVVSTSTEVSDLSVRERLFVAPLVVAIVAIGVFPLPIIQRVSPTAIEIVQRSPEAYVNAKPPAARYFLPDAWNEPTPTQGAEQ